MAHLLPATTLAFALAAALLTELRGTILNADTLRSYDSRRVAVDVLKKLQTGEALAILREAKNTVEQQRGGLSGAEQALADDLLGRIQNATSPYFDK